MKILFQFQSIMGVFFYTNSVAFIEDVPLNEGETYQSQDELTNDIEAGFQQVPCVSRIVAFMVKNIDTKILFECLVGWVDFSTVEIKKKTRHKH